MSKYQSEFEEKIVRMLDILIIEQQANFKNEYDIWKSTFQSVKALVNLLENELKSWKGSRSSMFRSSRSLYLLKEITFQFIQKCEEYDMYRNENRIATFDKKDFLDHYRKKCIPLVISFSHGLEINHPLRMEIERRLRRYNVPMMY